MLQQRFKKNKRALLLIVLLFGLLCFTSITGAQTRRAFLVGIDEYNPEKNSPSSCRKGFSNLSSCINDVEAMAGILESRFDFKPGNLHVLINGKATSRDFKRQANFFIILSPYPASLLFHCSIFTWGNLSKPFSSLHYNLIYTFTRTVPPTPVRFAAVPPGIPFHLPFSSIWQCTRPGEIPAYNPCPKTSAVSPLPR